MTPEIFKLINSVPQIQEAMEEAVLAMRLVSEKLPPNKKFDNDAQRLSDSVNKLLVVLRESNLDKICTMYHHPSND